MADRLQGQHDTFPYAFEPALYYLMNLLYALKLPTYSEYLVCHFYHVELHFLFDLLKRNQHALG